MGAPGPTTASPGPGPSSGQRVAADPPGVAWPTPPGAQAHETGPSPRPAPSVTVQRWARGRTVLGLVPPLAGAVAALAWSVELAWVLVGLTLYTALDWLLDRGPGALRAGSLQARSSVDVEGDLATPTTGGVVRWEVELSGDRRRRDLAVVPLVPAGATVLPPRARRLSLAPGRPLRLVLRVRLDQPGRVVLPGLLVRRFSPLGLFVRTLFVPAGEALTVVPSCRTSADPRLWRLLRGSPGGTGQAGRRSLGRGGEFAELRPYRFPDPPGRVDWKATARARELIVREVEAPPDYAVRVLLDLSPDMTVGLASTGGFGQAADLVGRLSWVTSRAGITLRVQGHDDRPVLDRRVRRPSDHQRLLAALVAAPREVLTEAVRARAERDELLELARQVHGETLAAWRGVGAAATLEDLLGPSPEVRALVDFVADLQPWRLVTLTERCTACREQLHADESVCAACGAGAPDGLAPRAECLAALLAGALRSGAGRELLVVVSALQGGEACETLAGLLELAAAGHRSVHLVVPESATLADWRPTHPSSIPAHLMETVPILADVERLGEVHRVEALLERLGDAGVHCHRLEDRQALDGLIVELVEREVLAP